MRCEGVLRGVEGVICVRNCSSSGEKRTSVSLCISATRISKLHCASAPWAGCWRQELTLVHFSAQLERFVWDRGCA